ncbi:12375_t:CDS:2 [Ambispora gerdemannii]|uniref:12375_t:CDS:1 n=1 Tax=Ambispora gerdemannii TaxID=144530 RepID=A0A9N8UXI6_9GLOM|nr:12375_t:CDS:2 [Ambispora gerdemannii]
MSNNRKTTLAQSAEYNQGPIPVQVDPIRQGPLPQQYDPHIIHKQTSYSSLSTDSSRYHSHQLDPRELDRKNTISSRADARGVSPGSQLDPRDIQRSNSVSPRPDMARPQGDFHHQSSISRRQNNSSPYLAADPREELVPSRQNSGSTYPDTRSSPQPPFRQNNASSYLPESREGGESLQPQQHDHQQPYYSNGQYDSYDNRNYNQRNAGAYPEDSYDYSPQQHPSNKPYLPPLHPNPNYPPPPPPHQEEQYPSQQQHLPQGDYSSLPSLQTDLYQHPQGDYPPPQEGYGYNGYQQNYPVDANSYYGDNVDGAPMPSNYYPPDQKGQFYEEHSSYSQDYPQQGYPLSHPQEYSQDPYGSSTLGRQYSMKGPLPNRQYDADNSNSVKSVDVNKPSYTPEAIEAYRSKAKSADSLLQEAVKIIRRLATQGVGFGKPAYPEAQFYLAGAYGHGALGLPFDQEKAFSLYMQASKQNHSSATYRTAVCYEVGGGTKRDPHRATQFFRKAAALGDTAAMYKLGTILLMGLLSQTKNPREAVTWLKRAAQKADEENPHALHELGLLHERKDIQKEIPSIIHDERFALEQFHRAADLGYAPSCLKLGCVYEYGQLNVPINPQKSIYYYSKAAEQEDADAELALSGWYLTGSEPVLKQSDTEAYLWARKAADKGLSKAEYAIGYYSELGIGVNQDPEEARRWYLRAAAQGNKRAQHRLTELKKLGNMRRLKPERYTRAQAKKEDCVIC